MIMEIPNYKNIIEEQTIDFTSKNLCTLIGENGSGKSTLLEAIFTKYINEENEFRNEENKNLLNEKRCIVFSSGQNELFSQIFNNYEKNSKRYNREESQMIRSFYFDYFWSRVLVYFATSLKPIGLVRNYLKLNGYIEEDNSIDISSYISLFLRVRKPIIDKIEEELDREGNGEYLENPLYRSLYIKNLEKLINYTLNEDFDFSDEDNRERIVSTNINVEANRANNTFGSNINEIFTFFARASTSWLSNFNLEDISLYFKDDLEFEQLSDGEYQLLAIYALIDLFDNENTIFLLDEVDSHLHYKNISNLWSVLKDVSGKVITTTHISESILNNSFDSISYIENGKIINDLVPKKILEKLSSVVNHDKFIYQISSKLENIVLIDDESDWEIFKELVRIKIPNYSEDIFNMIIPIKQHCGWNYEGDLFGSTKIEFTRKIKEFSTSHDINLKNIFMICDKDEYPIASIKNNMQCKDTPTLTPYMNNIKEFNDKKTKAHLLSWRRREVLHYVISYTMLEKYEKLDELKIIAPYLTDVYKDNNFDNDDNVKYTNKKNVKFIKLLMCKENGNIEDDNWTDYDKIKEVIAKIPPSEISEDIVKMYDFIKSKI